MNRKWELLHERERERVKRDRVEETRREAEYALSCEYLGRNAMYNLDWNKHEMFIHTELYYIVIFIFK